MDRGTDRGRLQFTGRHRGRCYPLSGRKRRPHYARHPAVGNWSLMPMAYRAFVAGPMAAAQRLDGRCRFGRLLLWARFSSCTISQ